MLFIFFKGSEKKREKLSSSVRAVRKRMESKTTQNAFNVVSQNRPLQNQSCGSDLVTGTSHAVADPASKLRYILRDSRFFLIKSNNHENVSLAKAKVGTPEPQSLP